MSHASAVIPIACAILLILATIIGFKLIFALGLFAAGSLTTFVLLFSTGSGSHSLELMPRLRWHMNTRVGCLFIGVNPDMHFENAGVQYAVRSISLTDAMKIVHAHMSNMGTVCALRGDTFVHPVAELLSVTERYLTFDWLRSEILHQGDQIILVESPYMSEALDPRWVNASDLVAHGVKVSLVEITHVNGGVHA
jgi:hypothetical protein